MKKKDIFWLILNIVAGVMIIAGGVLVYLNISKYSVLQSEFSGEVSESLPKLLEAIDKKELPKKEWVAQTNTINKGLEQVFDKFQEKINIFGTKNNVKHLDFFENLKNKNEYKGNYPLDNVNNSNIGQISYEFGQWLDNLAKKGESSSTFAKWYSELKNTYNPDFRGDYTPEKILETPANIYNMNKDFEQYFKSLYTNLFLLIWDVANAGGSEKKEEELRQFTQNYNTLLPSLLLTKHLVDNIPEFKNVTIEAIYISSYDPIALSKIKMYKSGNKVPENLVSQPLLCFCYKDSSLVKPAPQGFGTPFTFNCYPNSDKKLSYEISSRYWNVNKENEKVDDNILNLSTEGIQYRMYPKELGTTIPIVFTFKADYEGFINLLKGLYRINGGENRKSIFDFGENSPGLPIPVTVSKISFKVDDNISSDYFIFKKEVAKYQDPNTGESAWKSYLEEEEKKRIENLKNNIKNNYFKFLVEILIFLYDPDGFKECWNNIPQFSSPVIAATTTTR